MPESILFDGLIAVVQYARKDGEQGWVTMAAFDSEEVAKKYCNKCSLGKSPWIYKVIKIS